MKVSTRLGIPAAMALSAIAVMAAATANASDTDDAFLQALSQQGITWDSTQTVISVGHAVCGDWVLGDTFQQVFNDVKQATSMSDNNVGYFIGAATQAYCPQYASNFPH